MTADRPLTALLTVLVAGVTTLSACTPERAPSTAPSVGSRSPAEGPAAPPAEDPERSTAVPSAGPDETAAGDGPETSEQPSEEPTATDAEGVEVVVTYVGAGSDPAVTEVVAYLPGVIEEGGTCTATVVGTRTTASAPAWPDVSSTSCGLIELAGAPTAGQEIVVTYTSPQSSGTSATVEVVP
jgi:hypothetical protein